MKKFILILVALLIMGCTEITVLEISIDQGIKQNRYKVTYIKDYFAGSKIICTSYFNTDLGVENFLTEVADKDYSDWSQL